MDVRLNAIIVGLLGLICVGCVAGSVYLAATGRDIPPSLMSVAGVAIAALVLKLGTTRPPDNENQTTPGERRQ